MPSRVSRIVLCAITWRAEFQTWMPLPRRFWFNGVEHISPSPGFSVFVIGSTGSIVCDRPRMVLSSMRTASACRT
jgi:hypothetical protein